MTMTETEEQKTNKIELLNSVSELLPPNVVLEYRVVDVIHQSLLSYMEYRKKTEGKYTSIDVSGEIEDDFAGISKNDFSSFPLKVSERTIGDFLKNCRIAREIGVSQPKLNTKNDSIRLIAAFLIYKDDSSLTIDDLILLDNIVGTNLSDFIGRFEEDEKLLESFEGIYEAHNNSGDSNSEKVNLILEVSSDRTHLIIEEKSISEKRTKEDFDVSRYGLGIISPFGNLYFILKYENQGIIHTYNATTIQVDDQREIKPDFFHMIKIKSAIQLSSLDNSIKGHFESEKYLKKIKESFYIFKKYGELLTFEQPFERKVRRTEQSKMAFMKKRRSAKLAVVETPRKVNIMDEKEKQRLSQELFFAAMDSGDDPDLLDKVYDLLDQGASINYKHPKTGSTPVHFLAPWSIGVLNEVFKRSSEEYDHTIRNKDQKLASWFARFRKEKEEGGTYDELRKREVEAAEKKGFWPDVQGDIPLKSGPK